MQNQHAWQEFIEENKFSSDFFSEIKSSWALSKKLRIKPQLRNVSTLSFNKGIEHCNAQANSPCIMLFPVRIIDH